MGGGGGGDALRILVLKTSSNVGRGPLDLHEATLGFKFNVAPGLVSAPALKTNWPNYSGHADCLGVPL